MKRLSITHTGGDNLVFDVPDLGDFPSAVARQDASWPLTLDDGSTLYVNTRHVVAWTAEDVDEPSQSDSEPEPDLQQQVTELQAQVENSRAELNSARQQVTALTVERDGLTTRVSELEAQVDSDRTVAELKAALDAAGVEYPSDARKADLQELAKTNNV